MAIVRGARGPAGAGATLSSATPQPLGTATAGVSTEASRADHVHTLPTIPALASTTPAALGVAAVGVGTTAARADHVHALPTIPAVSSATPQPIGTATAGVSDDAARADHVHALNTGLISAPDTGWTAAGDGTASITSGVATITVTSAQTSGVLRRAQVVCSPHLPAVEVIARATVTTAPTGGTPYAGVGCVNADIPANHSTVRGWLVQASDATNQIGLYRNESGSWVGLGTIVPPATLASGTLWLRLVYSALGVSAFAGSGATIPSSWSLIASAAASVAISGPGTVSQIVVYAGRSGGSGDLVCDIEDIQWRSLLGAPT